MTEGKHKSRTFVLSILCFFICGYVIYSVGSIFYEVSLKTLENEKLAIELEELKEKQEALKVEVNKLRDPEYIARYAREKYLYSKENEYIFRIR